MAIVEIDFSAADKADFQPLPEGWYEVAVYEAKLEESRRGTQMIRFELSVTEPPEHRGRKLWHRNIINGVDNNRHLKRTLAAMGVTVSGVAKIDLNELAGRLMSVLVRHETFEGRIRERVVAVAPAGKATYERAESEVGKSGNGDINF